MSSSTQNKANTTLGKSTKNVADPAATKAPAKTTVKKAISKKTTVSKVESQDHIADQMSVFSSTRVWPD